MRFVSEHNWFWPGHPLVVLLAVTRGVIGVIDHRSVYFGIPKHIICFSLLVSSVLDLKRVKCSWLSNSSCCISQFYFPKFGGV